MRDGLLRLPITQLSVTLYWLVLVIMELLWAGGGYCCRGYASVSRVYCNNRPDCSTPLTDHCLDATKRTLYKKRSNVVSKAYKTLIRIHFTFGAILSREVPLVL